MRFVGMFPQAFKNHQIVDVFHRPGECDLTVNVDFSYLAEAAADLGASLSRACHGWQVLASSDDSPLFPPVPVAPTIALRTQTFRCAATSHGPIPQADFLQRMGLEARVNALKRSAKDDARKKQIEGAAKRLVDRTGMGTQYQVMALTGRRAAEPADEEKWPFVAV